MSLIIENHAVFTHQPENITALEGDTVKFNCSSTDSRHLAFWIINGSEFSWRSFRSIPTYNFDLQDNSLTIINVTRNLNGTPYQCVINWQVSQIGYLTVIAPTCPQEHEYPTGSSDFLLTSGHHSVICIIV